MIPCTHFDVNYNSYSYNMKTNYYICEYNQVVFLFYDLLEIVIIIIRKLIKAVV